MNHEIGPEGILERALKTVSMMELEVSPTLRHAAEVPIWASLFSSATQAQLTDQGPQLAASHSDQGKKSKWHPHLSPPKPGEPGHAAASVLSSLRSSVTSLGGPNTGGGLHILTVISTV